MNYQKEYANLVGQIDRALSILELYQPGDPIVRKAGDLLLAALRDAEEHYLQDTLQEKWGGGGGPKRGGGPGGGCQN